VKIRAPAKINFGLRITGKRADGYHRLDTILIPVSLYDEIEIKKLATEKTEKKSRALITLSCDQPSIPLDEKNLAYRAAREILDRCRIAARLHIDIRKQIPVGAGLGGGSTDAAATLVGLNKLLRLGLSDRQLEKIGVRLGADVPFFIRGKPARARGIGDRLTLLKDFPRRWLIILYPKFAVSTGWVYRNYAFKLTKPMPNTSIEARLGNTNGINELLVNDLEAVTIARFPQIDSLKRGLIRTGALAALMSGSGSSVFGIFSSHQKAIRAFDQLQRESSFDAFLVRTLN
jgi:4-diphosphocytidyl-2-C-methyl-D-erythritol kinase